MILIDHLTVDKIFYLSKLSGLRVDRQFVSHTTPDEISRMLTARHHLNINPQRLEHLAEQNRRHGCEIVLLKGKRGNLFQEIFTHRGKGTLLTSDYPNVIRPGRLSDVMDITLLMKPYIRSGSILPVSEDQLAAEIAAYFVYTVNNSIVAVARLKDYGEAAELAKFCTLPRYQGKGRARELAERMIETARNQRKTYIFALSIEPRMFMFFRNLGFQTVEREQLPAEWRRQYDLNRPSRAFRLKIGLDAG
jgi:amino-acid N-acetyltransferase